MRRRGNNGRGARLPRDTSFSAVLPKQPPKPILARPQLSFGTWLRACLGLGVGAAPKSCDRGKTYSLAAAHRVAEDVAIDKIRAKRVAPPAVDEEEEELSPLQIAQDVHDLKYSDGSEFRDQNPLPNWNDPNVKQEKLRKTRNTKIDLATLFPVSLVLSDIELYSNLTRNKL